jgi:predicted Zn-dependent peptidase
MEISHIEKITNKDVREFFNTFYAPCKAILTVTGNIDAGKAFGLAEKWFGPIPERDSKKRNLPCEPEQTGQRELTVRRKVPSDALYKAWHIGPRISKDFFTLDVLTDLLAGGESGRLYNRLVREKSLFTEINAYITSDIDPGLLIVSGKLMRGTDMETAEKELMKVIEDIKDTSISDNELEKVKNRYGTSTVLSNTSILQKAMNLSLYELLGDAEMINQEVSSYRSVTKQMVAENAAKYLRDGNCTTLHYLSDNKER